MAKSEVAFGSNGHTKHVPKVKIKSNSLEWILEALCFMAAINSHSGDLSLILVRHNAVECVWYGHRLPFAIGD